MEHFVKLKNYPHVKTIPFLLLIIILISGYSKDNAEPKANAIWVRIENMPGNDFDNGSIASVNLGLIKKRWLPGIKN